MIQFTSHEFYVLCGIDLYYVHRNLICGFAILISIITIKQYLGGKYNIPTLIFTCLIAILVFTGGIILQNFLETTYHLLFNVSNLESYADVLDGLNNLYTTAFSSSCGLSNAGSSIISSLIPAIIFGLWYCWKPSRSIIGAGIIAISALIVSDIIILFDLSHPYLLAFSLISDCIGGIIAGIIIHWFVTALSSYHLLFSWASPLAAAFIAIFYFLFSPASTEIGLRIERFNNLTFEYERPPGGYHLRSTTPEGMDEGVWEIEKPRMAHSHFWELNPYRYVHIQSLTSDAPVSITPRYVPTGQGSLHNHINIRIVGATQCASSDQARKAALASPISGVQVNLYNTKISLIGLLGKMDIFSSGNAVGVVSTQFGTKITVTDGTPQGRAIRFYDGAFDYWLYPGSVIVLYAQPNTSEYGDPESALPYLKIESTQEIQKYWISQPISGARVTCMGKLLTHKHPLNADFIPNYFVIQVLSPSTFLATTEISDATDFQTPDTPLRLNLFQNQTAENTSINDENFVSIDHLEASVEKGTLTIGAEKTYSLDEKRLSIADASGLREERNGQVEIFSDSIKSAEVNGVETIPTRFEALGISGKATVLTGIVGVPAAIVGLLINFRQVVFRGTTPTSNSDGQSRLLRRRRNRHYRSQR